MRYRTVVLAISLVFAGLTALAAVSDVTGKWVAQVPGRDGQTRETTFNFKVEGDKLTGTMSGMQGDTPISDGVVKGDEISFNVKLNFQGNEVVLVYKGKVMGDEIKMTRSRQGSDRPGQEITAKRVK